jgi:hypothetical protein
MTRDDIVPTSFAVSSLRGGPLDAGASGAGAHQPSFGHAAAMPANDPAGNDKVDAVLSLFPGPVTLWPNRLRILGALALALILIALVLVGVLPPFSAKHQMIYLATFVGMALLFAILLLPGAFSRTLDEDGFERVALFLTFRRPWQRTDILTFWRMTYRGLSAYGPRMQCAGNGDSGRSANNDSRSLIGRIAALANCYNLSAKEIVALMSQWRARALAQDD